MEKQEHLWLFDVSEDYLSLLRVFGGQVHTSSIIMWRVLVECGLQCWCTVTVLRRDTLKMSVLVCFLYQTGCVCIHITSVHVMHAKQTSTSQDIGVIWATSMIRSSIANIRCFKSLAYTKSQIGNMLWCSELSARVLTGRCSCGHLLLCHDRCLTQNQPPKWRVIVDPRM